MSTKIIDVSTYNGTVNFDALAKAGLGGAIIKIVNKSLDLDSCFTKNYKGFSAKKIPWGVYNYTYATTVSKAQSDMKKICDILDKLDKKYFTLGVWFDIEDVCQARLSKSQNQKMIIAAKEVVEKRGYIFGVYTGMSFYKEHIGSDCGIKNWWIARYPSSAIHPMSYNPPSSYKPTVNNHVIAWQYTATMRGPVVGSGYGGKADCSILYSMPTGPAKKTTTTEIKTVTVTKKGYAGEFPVIPMRGFFKLGDKGAEVKKLQKLCNWFGSSLTVDGEIGSKTVAAIKKMQGILKVKEDGLYGKDTQKMAKAYKK